MYKNIGEGHLWRTPASTLQYFSSSLSRRKILLRCLQATTHLFTLFADRLRKAKDMHSKAFAIYLLPLFTISLCNFIDHIHSDVNSGIQGPHSVVSSDRGPITSVLLTAASVAVSHETSKISRDCSVLSEGAALATSEHAKETSRRESKHDSTATRNGDKSSTGIPVRLATGNFLAYGLCLILGLLSLLWVL